MSAAAQRADLAEIGRDLLATRGTAGERRAVALVAGDTPAPPSRFDRLTAVPAWLRWPHDDLVALARAVALRALAPSLAASIDGGWLGGIARVAGEHTLDWAIAFGAAPTHGTEQPIASLAPDGLAVAGFATMRAALPPDLRAYVRSDITAEPLSADAAMIAEAVAFVKAGAA